MAASRSLAAIHPLGNENEAITTTAAIRRDRTWEIVDEIYETQDAASLKSAEGVTFFGMTSAFTPAKVALLRSYRRKKNTRGLLLVGNILLFSLLYMFIVSVGIAYVPLLDAFRGGGAQEHISHILFSLPLATASIQAGLVSYVTLLANAPLRPAQLGVVVLVGSLIVWAAWAAFWFGVGWYPLPYTVMLGAGVAGPTIVAATYFTYPVAMRSGSAFRRVFLVSAFVFVANCSVNMLLVLFYSLFASATSGEQFFYALILPVVKIVTKIGSKNFATNYCDPSFAHGAGMFTEFSFGCFMALLFTAVDDTLTFVLLVALELLQNIVSAVQIAVVLDSVLDAPPPKQADGNEAAAAIVKSRAKQTCCAVVARATYEAGGVLARTTRVTRSAAKKIWRGCSGEEDRNTTNPIVAHLCCNLCCSELAEIFAPLLMAGVMMLIYYGPSGNAAYFTFMRDLSDAEFLQGMLYVLIDVCLETVTFLLLIFVIKRQARVDVLRVGFFLVEQHPWYYFLMLVAPSLFFLHMFLEHSGTDPHFEFQWLLEKNASAAGNGTKQNYY